MVKSRCGLCLPLKAGQGLRVFGDIVGQKLYGHKTVKLEIFGFVDHTHPATAEFVDNAVMRDGLADQLRQLSLSTRSY